MLISKFMTSTDWATNNYIYMFPSISRSKYNQAMKFGHLIKYRVRNIFLHIHAENEVGRLFPDLLLFF